MQEGRSPDALGDEGRNDAEREREMSVLGRWTGRSARGVRRRAPAVLGAALALAGCTDTPFDPVSTEDVEVTLLLSGGIAGIVQTVVVDGGARQVRISCTLCDLIADRWPISSRQVRALADALDAAGMPDLDGRDYGVSCCDFFEVDLTYRRGGRSARVTGSDDRLPAALRDVVLRILALGDGRIPVLVELASTEATWIDAPVSLDSARVDGLTLTAYVAFGGGCAEHRIDVVAWGGWLESFPVQVSAVLSHDDDDDPCDAIVLQERRFDLAPLRRAYEEAYGTSPSDPVTLILRLGAGDGSEPRLVELTF